MFVLAAVAAFYGLLLLWLYFQSISELSGSLPWRAHMLGSLPGISLLGAAGVMLSIGALQGVLHDIRAGQDAATRATSELLEGLVQSDRQRSTEVDMLASELDDRD